MSPPAPIPKQADIGSCWADEELCLLLEKIRHGSPLPANVIPDVNPYRVIPSNLPDADGLWYLISSEEKKNTEHGFWKAKGEECVIFSNSAITGWRITLEFYEGQACRGQRTDWVMHEYMITQKGPCDNRKPKDSRSLCRVFCPVHEMLAQNGGADISGRNHFHSMPSTVEHADSSTEQGSTCKSQEMKRDLGTGPLALADRLPDAPVENFPELDYISRGDYLELGDLADPESPSSSDNLSCMSFTSHMFFDSLALLRNLEDGNQEQQGNDVNFNLSLSASVTPKEMLLHPATLGSLVSGNGSESPTVGTQKSDYSLPGIDTKSVDGVVLERAVRSMQAEYRNEGTSNSRNVMASSSSHKAVLKVEKKALVGPMKKLRKKYLCLLPF